MCCVITNSVPQSIFMYLDKIPYLKVAAKRRPRVLPLCGQHIVYRTSDEHWHCFKGSFGTTSERWGGAHMDFSERIDTILNWTELNWNWTVSVSVSVTPLTTTTTLLYILCPNCDGISSAFGETVEERERERERERELELENLILQGL